MSRSTNTSIRIPHPIRDALRHQLTPEGPLDYPSENAMWIGLAQYQLLIGKPHPITQAIAKMGQEDQDLINDFLYHIAMTGEALKGSYLTKLIDQAIEGSCEPTSQDVQELLPAELLRVARRWRDAA